jgi:hypothetical protein
LLKSLVNEEVFIKDLGSKKIISKASPRTPTFFFWNSLSTFRAELSQLNYLLLLWLSLLFFSLNRLGEPNQDLTKKKIKNKRKSQKRPLQG